MWGTLPPVVMVMWEGTVDSWSTEASRVKLYRRLIQLRNKPAEIGIECGSAFAPAGNAVDQQLE